MERRNKSALETYEKLKKEVQKMVAQDVLANKYIDQVNKLKS